MSVVLYKVIIIVKCGAVTVSKMAHYIAVYIRELQNKDCKQYVTSLTIYTVLCVTDDPVKWVDIV